jgi:hypothetical protein
LVPCSLLSISSSNWVASADELLGTLRRLIQCPFLANLGALYDKWLRARAYLLGSFWSSLIQEPTIELDFFFIYNVL